MSPDSCSTIVILVAAVIVIFIMMSNSQDSYRGVVDTACSARQADINPATEEDIQSSAQSDNPFSDGWSGSTFSPPTHTTMSAINSVAGGGVGSLVGIDGTGQIRNVIGTATLVAGCQPNEKPTPPPTGHSCTLTAPSSID